MKILKDPILLILLGILALSLLAFLTGVLPYPFGMLILSIYIVARILHKT